MKAYVLIKTVNGSAVVSDTLRSMPGIESVEEVTGALDAIAVATFESLSDLLDTVLAKIRQLPGVLHVLPRPSDLLMRDESQAERSCERLADRFKGDRRVSQEPGSEPIQG